MYNIFSEGFYGVGFLVTPVSYYFHCSFRKRTLEEYEADSMSSSRLSLSQRFQTYLYYPPHKRVLRWFGLDRLAGDAIRKPLPGYEQISDIPMKEMVV